MALAQALVAVTALIAGFQHTPASSATGILVLNGFFGRCFPAQPGCFGLLHVRKLLQAQGRISLTDAATLRAVHGRFESGFGRGKIVLEGF